MKIVLQISALFCILAAIAARTAGAKPLKSEKHYLEAIKKHSEEKNGPGAQKLAAEFLKAYPASTYIPDVRLVLADQETSPSEALLKYKLLVNKFRYFNRNDYAQNKICEIHYLTSNWQELKAESLNAKHKFPSSRYRDRFSMFLIISELYLGEYDSAGEECRHLVENNHEYNTLAAALLLRAYIHKKSSGLSKQYIGTIREIAVGFDKSDAMPATLFLLAEFYEHKKLYNEAYSAYSDLSLKFPGSPEAAEAGKRISVMMKHGPIKVSYLPKKNLVDNTESLDISPDIDLPEKDEPLTFYSIAVGPFSSLKGAAEIKKLLAEYDFVKTVRLNTGYAVYVARCADEDAVLKVKIRLAEEYGLNGRIVRISSDGKNSYSYGE